MKRLEPPRRIPLVQQAVQQALAPLQRNAERGWGVDSETVVFEQLPDGRLRARLHPSIVARFKL